MSEAAMTETRYRATFRPQAWIGDNAVEVDPEGETSWDATDFIASALASDEDRSWAERTIARGSDHDDVLRMDPAAPEWVREWRGPFDTDLEVVGREHESRCGWSTYTELRDWLDGYTSPDGTIQGDPATIAVEAAAAGLVAKDAAYHEQLGGDEDAERLDAQVVRDAAHHEAEIARLLGPSDYLEAAWLRYCEDLIEVSDAYLAVAKGGD